MSRSHRDSDLLQQLCCLHRLLPSPLPLSWQADALDRTDSQAPASPVQCLHEQTFPLPRSLLKGLRHGTGCRQEGQLQRRQFMDGPGQLQLLEGLENI